MNQIHHLLSPRDRHRLEGHSPTLTASPQINTNKQGAGPISQNTNLHIRGATDLWKDTQHIVAWIASGVPKPEQWVGLTQESWSPETRPVGWGGTRCKPS